MRWLRKRRHAELERLTQHAEKTAQEAHQMAERAEPALSRLEQRASRNAIYEEVLATLRPRGTA